MLKTNAGELVTGKNEGAAAPSGVRFLRRPEVLNLCGFTESYLYELVSENRFPQPVKIAPRLSVWVEGEVHAWQMAKIAERTGAA